MKPFAAKNVLHRSFPFFFFLFPITFFLIWGFFFSGTEGKAASSQELSEKILRFHVIANSDAKEDQDVKIKVKETVLTYLSPFLSYAKDKEEAKQIIENHMDGILNTAKETLEKNGFSYPAEVSVTDCEFPVKSYGDLLFPAGTYEAVRIVLGEGKGKNWWCVMYPPLCFVDASFGTVPQESKDQLGALLSEDTYDSLLASGQEEQKPIPFCFGIFTFLNDLFHLG